MAEPTLDDRIDTARQAMLRRQERLQTMEREADGARACCPSCFHGRVYAELADEQERDGEKLRALLAERGGLGDARFAEWIRMSVWP